VHCGTNYVLILVSLELSVSKVSDPPMHNWQAVNWEAFNEGLEDRLQDIPGPVPLLSEGEFHAAVHNLTAALNDITCLLVPKAHPSP